MMAPGMVSTSLTNGPTGADGVDGWTLIRDACPALSAACPRGDSAGRSSLLAARLSRRGGLSALMRRRRPREPLSDLGCLTAHAVAVLVLSGCLGQPSQALERGRRHARFAEFPPDGY